MKRTIGFFIIICILLSILTPVFAASHFSFNISSDSKSLLENAKSLESIEGLTYKSGDRCDPIYYLQYLLYNCGYLTIDGIDGDFGKKTTTAVENFQKDEGLKKTGYLDLPTQFLLTVKSPQTEITKTDNSTIYFSNNYAVICWENEALYIGYAYQGGQMIEGTYLLESGSYYAGSFSNNKRQGNGTAYFSNGDVYIGQWFQDKMHGQGKYYFGGLKSKETYEGNWVNNTMDGNGTYILSNGTKVTGTWGNNKHVGW